MQVTSVSQLNQMGAGTCAVQQVQGEETDRELSPSPSMEICLSSTGGGSGTTYSSSQTSILNFCLDMYHIIVLYGIRELAEQQYDLGPRVLHSGHN